MNAVRKDSSHLINLYHRNLFSLPLQSINHMTHTNENKIKLKKKISTFYQNKKKRSKEDGKKGNFKAFYNKTNTMK